MSFSFGFSGDDIDEESNNSIFSTTEVGNGNSSNQLGANQANYKSIFMNSSSSTSSTNVSPVDAAYLPRKLALQDLLSKSIGVRMSYGLVNVDSSPKQQNQDPQVNQQSRCISDWVCRRDLFDVKHQLMTQDTLSTTDEILLGLTNEDLRIATYEGGLKSWECTFDLMEVLRTRDLTGYGKVLELGCGTGLPSALLFQNILRRHLFSGGDRPRKLTLADYNESVLRLVTVPNLLFIWCEFQNQDLLAELQTTPNSDPGNTDPNGAGNAMELRSGEIEVTEKLINAFVADLSSKSITLEFVSGGWSPEFVTLLKGSHDERFDLVLASETIYSPETLPIFTDTMLCLMHPEEQQVAKTEALVAAKRVYFGVGGGIPEFERALDARNISYKTISEENSQGVVRAILQVSL